MNRKEWEKLRKICPWENNGKCENFNCKCSPENCYKGITKYEYTLSCGIHKTCKEEYAGKPCYKCIKEQENINRGLIQHNGTPWIAILQKEV